MNDRRTILVIFWMLAAVWMPVPVARAGGGGPHGAYSPATQACGACHRTHSSGGSSLNKNAAVRGLCLSCHDGTGSLYNTLTGEIVVDGRRAPSPAGPMSPASEGGPASSAHLTEASFDPPGGAPAATTLTCASCHDPHGSPNHRMFRTTMAWNGVATGVTFTATVLERGTPGERVVYAAGSVSACAACHPDYARRHGGNYTAGTRHRVDVPVGRGYTPGELPLEAGRLVCLSCHYAHGTRAVNTAAGGRGGASSALKRRDDWGVCSQCHFNQP